MATLSPTSCLFLRLRWMVLEQETADIHSHHFGLLFIVPHYPLYTPPFVRITGYTGTLIMIIAKEEEEEEDNWGKGQQKSFSVAFVFPNVNLNPRNSRRLLIKVPFAWHRLFSLLRTTKDEGVEERRIPRSLSLEQSLNPFGKFTTLPWNSGLMKIYPRSPIRII